MDEVIKLCDDFYLVGDTVIYSLVPGMLDGRDDDIRNLSYCKDDRFAVHPYGDLTAYGFCPGERGPYAHAGVKHFSDLPDLAKQALLKARPEYAGRI